MGYKDPDNHGSDNRFPTPVKDPNNHFFTELKYLNNEKHQLQTNIEVLNPQKP